MEALIRVSDMCKIYNPGENEVRALDHVNLTINEGICGDHRTVRVRKIHPDEHAGMSGCTDIRRLLAEWDGGCDNEGQRSVGCRNKEIGFIFQGFNLIPNLTALENVELPLIYRGLTGRQGKSCRSML